jgi:hypothetical protein
MKNGIIIAILFSSMLMFSGSVFSQGAPPPPAGGGLGGSNNQSGGGAPIGSGIGILLALGGAYGGRKFFVAYKKNDKIEE